MKDKSLKVFLSIFIAVLIATALIPQVGNDVRNQTDSLPVVNETIDISPARLGIKQVNISHSIGLSFKHPKLTSTTITMYNYTDGSTINSGNYTVNLTGTNRGYNNYSIYLVNNSYWGKGQCANCNYTRITYSYYHDNYVSQSNARTILNMMTLILALMILGVVIGYILKNKQLDVGT